jgi:tetratricopeptide (TPR) repeat protein
MDLPFLPQCESQICVRYHWAFPAAENEFTLSVTLPEFDRKIIEYHRLLKWSPQSDPSNRPALLIRLVGLRSQRNVLSNQKSDLDKVITHLTETILLPPTQDLVILFFHLAASLRSRFSYYRQPDDLKSSIKYFRFLRVNFHSLEAFDIPHTSGDLPTQLFTALAYNLVLTPGDMVQDLGEMVALIPEFLTTDILTYHPKHAIEVFSKVVTATEIFCRRDTQLVANQAIQVLREATSLNPDWDISLALALCLAARFRVMLAMSDYEEVIAIADKIVATHTPGNSPTRVQRNAMMLISSLLASRLDAYSRPEYLEDAVHRIRTFVPCLLDEDRTQLASFLNSLMGPSGKTSRASEAKRAIM